MNREKLEKNIASNLTIDLDVEKFIEVTLLDIEQYANQRVIEELEKIKELNVDIPVFGGGTTISAVTVENIDREIRILKQ